MAARKSKRNIYQDAKDILAQGLISVKNVAAFFKQTSHDKRTVKSTKRAAAELQRDRKPKEVAQQLGISTQKWVAIRKQIEKGKAYSPELRDVLKDARQEYNITPQQMENGVYFFPDLNKLKKTTHVDMIKGFPFLEDALEWWESIVASDTYIAIAEKNGMYYVVGLGKRSQRPKKGVIQEKGGRNRVKQLLAKYKD